MATQARANYDFDAQPGSGELTIKEGDILQIIRDNVDGGWIEGKNAKGKIGLFPESYVTRLTGASITPVLTPGPAAPQPAAALPKPPSAEFKPSFTKPPLPAVIGGSFPDPWADDTPAAAPPVPSAAIPTGGSVPSIPSAYPSLSGTSAPTANNHHVDDDFEDEWTEDDEDGAGGDATNQRTAVARSRSAGPDTTSLGRQGGGGTTRMKNINRFSNFVKTGMEAFILDTSKVSSSPCQMYEITFANNEVRWAPPPQTYSCVVDKPKKESKLKGLKSFIAYSLTSSLGGIQVSRRYKHFDWLYEQFSSKFLLIPSPPLPEKQVAGRYEEDLIEHRKNILQLWVNKICKHPVLGQSDVWMHFMTCTDEKKWKNGKRQAEKDEFVGGNFFHCVKVPPKAIDLGWMEQQIDGFNRCNRSMDESVRGLYERINESQKRLVGPYKSNWQKIAAAFGALGQSFEIDQSAGTTVTAAIKESAHVLHNIGQQHEEHGKRGMEQLLDWLYTYKGLLSNIPDMLNVHKSAIAKLRDNERLQAENKLTPQEAEAIRQRVDVITYALLAEITQLNEERNDDFRKMLGEYFEQQAAFYAHIGQQFSQLSQRFK